jgi:uncharacterized membrane protein
MRFILLFVITTLIFFAIDMVWLGFIAKSFYRQRLGFILSESVNWKAAIIFYLLYVVGIIYFAIYPALVAQNWNDALINGAMLGFLCYATYDLTNMATIAKWPLTVVIVDMAWGTILTGSVALVSFWVTKNIPFLAASFQPQN